MSTEKAAQTAARWLTTALDDFEAAKLLSVNGRFALSCFHSQQAGEKALKSALITLGADTWGHSLLKLIDVAKETRVASEFQSVRKEAKTLDRFYIPTRYPDGLPDISPADAFDAEDAAIGLQCAEKIIALVRSTTGL